jgi:HlyD family secretion protein
VLLTLVIIAGLIVGGFFGLRAMDAQPDRTISDANFEAKRGPLTISVTESGSIQSREQVIITNQVEGRTEIIYIIEEGARVEEGDLLVELDSSELNDQKINQDIQVQNAEAAFIRARENLAVAKSQAESDIAQAELDHRFAKEDRSKYIEGEYPKEKKELQTQITLAEEELERAVDRLEGSERLFAEKYIAETELESDRLAKNRAELEYELAQANLDLLEQYTYPRRIDELESNIRQTGLALDRVKRKASADVVQAEADLRAAEAEFRRQRDRLAKIEDQIKKTKIHSPAAGMVIYATSVNRNRWRDDEPLEAGYQAREREELIYLPTADSMMAEVSIHESALEKIDVGQPVRITIPAVPGRTFTGTVARIAPLPDDGGWWNPDLRVYETQIHINETIEGVRTGMTCNAEIIVAEFHDAVYVPVQSVVRHGNRSAVFVETESGDVEPRTVSVGMDNNTMVKIESGLQPGERVSLTPSLDDFTEQLDADTNADTNPNATTQAAGYADGNGDA